MESLCKHRSVILHIQILWCMGKIFHKKTMANTYVKKLDNVWTINNICPIKLQPYTKVGQNMVC